MRTALLASACCLGLIHPAVAQDACPADSSPVFAADSVPNASTAATAQVNVDPSSDPAVAAMLQQSYGQTAAATADQLGVSQAAVAEIGQAESNFRNVPTANGSSSATGPWQITSGTFSGFSNQYGLGYTAADQTNPNAQAVVASYIVRDYASAVQNATGSPATVAQTWGAYIYGPDAGAEMASANPSAPLSSYVSEQALRNNGMTGWSVGQFYNNVSRRLGPGANQPALVQA